MLKNYLVTSFRNLLRFKSYSLINIFGLTVGLATSIFIFLWVVDELSYDRYHAKSDRIFRVMGNYIYPDGKIDTYQVTPLKLAAAIRAQLPEIDEVTQMSFATDLLVNYGSKTLNETGYYSDATVFSIFSFPVVTGDAAHPLPNTKSIAISEKLAQKLFGNEDPIGKSLRVNHTYDLAVTSVFANIPHNSTLQFDFIISFELWEKENPWAQGWQSGGLQTLVTLKPTAKPEVVNEKLKDIIKRNCDECPNHPFLYRYCDLRLNGKFENGQNTGGRVEQVMLFSLVAGIILVIACINFMNLATARSATRSREVGVRKSIGAQQSGLVLQFMIESVLLSFFSLVIALAAVQLLLPFFNGITNKSIHLDFGSPVFVTGITLITLVCGLLAGSYPAFFLASFKPAAVLKGTGQTSLSGGGGIRKTLVVIQFMTSMILVTGSLVVYNQITYIGARNLGFDKENVVVINLHEGMQKNSAAFKNEILQFPSIKNIAFGGSGLPSIPITSRDAKWPGKPDDSSISFKVFRCDESFIPLMGIKLLAGRNFVDLNNQDASNYIINRKAMNAMGLTPENVVGTELEMWNGKGKIIGLTNDFNNGNLRESIEPLIFMYSTSNGSYYYIRIDGKTSIRESLAHIESTLKKYDPDYPFTYMFLDEMFDSEYRLEAIIGKLSLSFTAVAVLISCLGLFGLASFTAERRMKELGVRKVLGASTMNLVTLLCSDFTKLVVIALIIACPIALYLTRNFLNGYAYHADLTVLDFIVPALGMLLLTLLTVGQQSFKAAIGNPVNALKSE